MKIVFIFFLLAFGYIFTLWRWGGMDKAVLSKWEDHLQYEKKSLQLARENRLLRMKISDLNYRVSQLQSKNKYFIAQEAKTQTQSPQEIKREVASIPLPSTNDLVKFDVYRWSPEKLLAMGEKEFHFKNYEKSSQFYAELLERFPKSELISDRVLFGAGVSAFETGNKFDVCEKYLTRLVQAYPKSEFYRGAKLWLALAQYNQGHHQKFLSTVEEFRLKYRNTDEWKILSRYYEDISYKIKQ